MNWLHYLLEANLYLVVFYGMYKLLLQHSTFYNSNRYFLLLSVVAAFAIPLIQLAFLKPTVVLEIEEIPYEIPLATIEIATVAKSPALTAQDYIFYGYLALALFLSLKFIISISKIIKIYISSNKRKLSSYTLVELTTQHTAFSFFNILFIHPEMAKNSAVLRHEMIHIKQKHSWDILLLELLKICCWFNPIVYLMKKDITLLHEYIADEKTTAANISKHEYAMFLIENSMAAYSSSLVNQLFNQSILKSRINMLNKEKTANWARLKYLLAVPLGVGLLCVSTLSFSKSYGFLEIGTQKQVQQTTPKNKQEKPVYYPEHRYDEKNNFISLEKRAIIVNGKLVADKNKYYGVAEADEITYLNKH
ncbi:M56 family metallopeptidase [Pedobacter sp. SL55]|uniref:M56 family metallopeptidase n=1 Tax=Pedobacter sp. SL55 TaxID=2995161 RepID=UPI00226E671B|nr:M56 family metallopeptidase [Pedobacter sp. SL55]WAC40620.1 M56 family metallopeptidase [Pedobacter sp. SL55]